jgi:hypothetical protein
MTLSARLSEAATGRPMAGQTITFSVGSQTVSSLTEADGSATTTLTPTGTPSAISLSLTFAGGGGFTGSSASLLLPLLSDETVLTYTGKPALASGQILALTQSAEEEGATQEPVV